jgi:hypothetical protein
MMAGQRDQQPVAWFSDGGRPMELLGDGSTRPTPALSQCDACEAFGPGPWTWYAGPAGPGRGSVLWVNVCAGCLEQLTGDQGDDEP